MEAIDRAHQFGVGGLHRSGRFRYGASFLRGAELFSLPLPPVNCEAPCFARILNASLDSSWKSGQI
jgi:hypothetical protein